MNRYNQETDCRPKNHSFHIRVSDKCKEKIMKNAEALGFESCSDFLRQRGVDLSDHYAKTEIGNIKQIVLDHYQHDVGQKWKKMPDYNPHAVTEERLAMDKQYLMPYSGIRDRNYGQIV